MPKQPMIRIALLKRGLLLFWAAWLSVVFATNLCDGLKALGVLPPSWSLRRTITPSCVRHVCQTTARYSTQAWVNGLLFAGVIGWEGLVAVLFWLAGATYRGRWLYSGFAAGMALWVAFILTDAVFVVYALASVHRAAGHLTGRRAAAGSPQQVGRISNGLCFVAYPSGSLRFCARDQRRALTFKTAQLEVTVRPSIVICTAKGA